MIAIATSAPTAAPSVEEANLDDLQRLQEDLANLDGELALGTTRYAPGASTGDDLYTHKGEEAGLVLEGRIELTLGDEVFLLETGDSFSFPSTIPHTYRNPGDTPAAVIWANTPITLRR